MGYGRHVGRVGALAVALGVGLAVASTPGIAYADPSSDSSPSSGSSGDSSSGAAGGGSGTDGKDGGAATSGPDSGPTGGGGDEKSADAASAGDEDTDDTEDKSTAGDESAEEETPADDDATPPVGDAAAPGDADPPAVEVVVPPVAEEQDQPTASDSEPPADETANRSAVSAVAVAAPVADSVDPAAAAVVEEEGGIGYRSFTLAATDPAPQAASSGEVFDTVAAAPTSVAPAPAPAPPTTLIGVVADFISAILSPLLSPAQGSPIQMPILTAVLGAVRNEFERIFNPRKTTVAAQQSTSLVNSLQALPPEDQHVLVIGIDGANLSRILALPEGTNTNFLTLLGTSTTSASSIVGHTTISNPSWTSILTGAWGERTGVINNVFTPWTYNRFPTMFNQLEALEQDIDTTVIANWNVINAIGAAGGTGADTNLYVTQEAGDTDWLATDNLVAQLTKDAIELQDETPSVIFSYFVGVDENGHMYGGASPQYQAALENMDDNLGVLLAAVEAAEANGEDWTIVVVTDHGHQPQQGFGHGFNSPDETATFVIVDGPGFENGWINQAYEIVDTTPSVLQIFGGPTPAGLDGVPIQTLGTGYDPGDTIDDLVDALNYEISQNTSPDFLTDAALTLRTIFTSIPYFIYDFGLTGNSGVPGFLALPAQLLFSGLYVATNIPAQIVAFGTGVYGARLFQILPPPAPDFPPVNPQESMQQVDTLRVVCVRGDRAQEACGTASVA